MRPGEAGLEAETLLYFWVFGGRARNENTLLQVCQQRYGWNRPERMNIRVLRETSVLGQGLAGEKERRRTFVNIVIEGEGKDTVRSRLRCPECDLERGWW